MTVQFPIYTIQITLGWTDSHLHRFIIHGKQYGIAQPGGIWFSDNPTQIKLSSFGFRLTERFVYEYDFGDTWQHQIRLEAILLPEPILFPFASKAGTVHLQKTVVGLGSSWHYDNSITPFSTWQNDTVKS